MYTTVLFDLDGTLTDPGIGITNSVSYALSKWDIAVNDRRELYKFIGPPLLESFARFYGFSEEQCLQALKYYREYFSKKGIFENTVYDGIEDLLKELKMRGKKIVLATSKPEEFAKRILVHFHLDGYFDFIGGASMDEKRNKKGDVIAYVLENIEEQNRDRIIMVGDREHDVLGAKEHGIGCIGVLYGYGTREELEKAGALYIASSIADILTYL